MRYHLFPSKFFSQKAEESPISLGNVRQALELDVTKDIPFFVSCSRKEFQLFDRRDRPMFPQEEEMRVQSRRNLLLG